MAEDTASKLAAMLYPQGWSGGLLGGGNALVDQSRNDQERGDFIQQRRLADAIMHKPMDNPMGFAMGTSNVGKPIRAFHGSPHDFDAFDMSKIGTGEGAQAYGHGLYFAENEGVARNYRDMLSGKTRGGATLNWDDPLEVASMRLHQFSGDPDAAINWMLERRPNPSISPENARAANFTDEAVKAIREGRATNKVDSGKMYEVNLHADPNKFLDWDKPLSGQGETVKQGIEPYFSKYYSGTKATHEALEDFPVPTRESVAESMKGDEVLQRIFGGRNYKIGDRAAASNALREAGIPGIKYLDQGSRGAGDGTRNFVVFDPKIIEIVRKYGLGALGLTGLLGAQEGEQTQ